MHPVSVARLAPSVNLVQQGRVDHADQTVLQEAVVSQVHLVKQAPKGVLVYLDLLVYLVKEDPSDRWDPMVQQENKVRSGQLVYLVCRESEVNRVHPDRMEKLVLSAVLVFRVRN